MGEAAFQLDLFERRGKKAVRAVPPRLPPARCRVILSRLRTNLHPHGAIFAVWVPALPETRFLQRTDGFIKPYKYPPLRLPHVFVSSNMPWHATRTALMRNAHSL